MLKEVKIKPNIKKREKKNDTKVIKNRTALRHNTYGEYYKRLKHDDTIKCHSACAAN